MQYNIYFLHSFFQPTDLVKQVDKRVYKGTYPTCHDFNQVHFSPDCAYLLVGFSAGQIQLIDPIRKEISKLYNEEVHFDFFFLLATYFIHFYIPSTVQYYLDSLFRYNMTVVYNPN